MSHKYVLLGKFQTDNLEHRFSQYKQMSGGNYNASVRQVMESEQKLKLVSILHLKSAKCEEFSLLHFLADSDDEKQDNLPTDSNDADFSTVLDESCDVEI